MYAYEKKNKQNSTYRVSIDGNENVNNFLRLVHLRSNHIIFSILMTQFIKDKNYSFIKKIKDSSKIIDIDDYDIRFRVSSENEIDNKKINELANLPVSQSDKIKFRYKTRISLILIDNEKEKLSIDLTYAKMADDIKNITNGIESFEVEIDYMNSNKLSDKTLSLILKEVQNIKKVIDGSQVITQKNELEKVKRKYKDLVYGSNNNSFNNLYSMQPISAEVQHIVDKIPNRYSVTDKAEGEKYVLIIKDDECYLISNNLIVKKLDQSIKGYNNSIIEGELIHLTSVNKYVFLGFDCLFYMIPPTFESMLRNLYHFLLLAKY